ncbi:DDE superfamily endonuclease [Nannocystis exedens]|uniref:DDE superfamily endonuclease n=1 Tax=Nannocystis exedens TaxID=54 RepID=A0A1I1XFE2_9BACT|nr:hypothetical protein NAEX_06538 [Nannocystis exedens]SFE06109.1 DDE superfamily endonuclease [Nannocystis exedens]
MTVKGGTTARVFLEFIDKHLAPKLRLGDIVVMDNLGAHHATGVRERIEARGATVVYQPPYSPDLNPIELAWAKIKTALRERGPYVGMTQAHVFNDYTRVTARTGHIGNGISLRDNAQVRIGHCYFDHSLLEGEGMSPSIPTITGYSSAVGGPGVVTNAESNIFVKTVEPLIRDAARGLHPAVFLLADPRGGRACGRLRRRGRDPADRMIRGAPKPGRARDGPRARRERDERRASERLTGRAAAGTVAACVI